MIKFFAPALIMALATYVVPLNIEAAIVTVGSLLDEMVDLNRLAEFPVPLYKTVQYSSYDRTSTVPEGEGWFNNADGFGNEPIPNFQSVIRAATDDQPGEYVMCDVAGPGAIVRLWTARLEGDLRVYLDDMNQPLYEGPAETFFWNSYDANGKAAGLDIELLKGSFYQEQASYCPFPFSKRCRIVWIGNPKNLHFYQIQIRRYEPKTAVGTFKPADLGAYASKLKRAADILSHPGDNWPVVSKRAGETFEVKLAPGAHLDAFLMEGPAAFERLILSVEAPDRDLALRQTLLHIAFDGYPSAQVQSPVGDFFGCAPGFTPHDSAPFTVRPDGSMECRYLMPFKKSARIAFQNLGNQEVTVRGQVLPANYTWKKERSMHFRARWRIDHNFHQASLAPLDIPYLVARGQGVYVGTATYLLNPSAIPSAGGSWWGEGDEKIFVDENFPSTFGTGSEDYYNYAWSRNHIFSHAYCGQPRNDGPANRGFVTNNRWHILDPLPFRNHIAFYMELMTHWASPGLAYARIAYYYGKPGLMDDHLPITPVDVREPVLPANWQPLGEGAAKNSIFFQAEDLLQGDATPLFVRHNVWSGGQCMRWTPKREGEDLNFVLPVAEDGTYVVRFVFAMDARSPSVTFDVNAVPCGPFNLYRAHDLLSRAFGSAPVALKKGEVGITLHHRADTPAERPSVGVDFLWLQRVGD
ncbi:MAG: hypothetical protein DRP64_11760 [Verrucomicrobia bacterium]|nr:MAG: hypothetical protein DRP64_11760 [Verrucomicrobiota bacterium]